jgi:hypothetical protein
MEMEDSDRQIGEKAVDGSGEEEIAQICLKTYRHGTETLIAVCDSDIRGREFREGNLHIEVCSDFYGDEKASLSEVEDALRGATMANFVGCKVVKHAIFLGWVDEENVLSIDGVLYAQMVRM